MTPHTALTVHSLTPGPNQRAIEYFNAVAAEVTNGQGSYKNDLEILVVVHAYENFLPFIQALDKFAHIAGLIIKNSTGVLRPEYGEKLKAANYPVLQITKNEFIYQQGSVLDRLTETLSPNRKLILMDHGGYFALLGKELLERLSPNKLIGITEYGANGEERWRQLKDIDRPILSIGRSAIKHASDAASAESIIDAATYYSQQNNVPLLNKRTRIGLIGYGRLGQGLAEKLSRNRISNIHVYDRDDLKLSGARDLKVVPKNQLLEECDIIFCATGNVAIHPDEYAMLKNDVFLFTVTSPDDELGLDSLLSNHVLTPLAGAKNTSIYQINATGKRLFLPFNGESPIIILPNGVGDPVIHQPNALHLAATANLFKSPQLYAKGVQPVEPKTEQAVARIWNRHFNL